MQFNAIKVQEIHFQPITRLKSDFTGPEGNMIPSLETVHELGVHLSSDATFHVYSADMETQSSGEMVHRNLRSRKMRGEESFYSHEEPLF